MKNRVEPFSPYTPGISKKAEYQPDVMGAMCDAAFLAFQLPEAPEELERDLDEVTCAWLRLRRASHSLIYEPMVATTRVTPKMWTTDGPPPSRKDIKILEEFYAVIVRRGATLEEYFDHIVERGLGMLSFFTLRNVVGLLGSREDSTMINGKAVWHKELSSAENIWAALSRLLRSNGSDIAKDKFSQLKAWMDAEIAISDFLEGSGDYAPCETETAGSKLCEIVRMAETCHKTKVDPGQILECVELLLDMEPKATTQYLMLDGKITVLMDMVIAQGLSCAENKTSIILWHVCTRLVYTALDLGCPTLSKPAFCKSGSPTPGESGSAAMSVTGDSCPPDLPSVPVSSSGSRSIVLPTLAKRGPFKTDHFATGSSPTSGARSQQSPPLPPILPSPGGSMKENELARTPSTKAHSESSLAGANDGEELKELKERPSTPSCSKENSLRRYPSDGSVDEHTITPDKLKPKTIQVSERMGSPTVCSDRSTSSVTRRASAEEVVKPKTVKRKIQVNSSKSLPDDFKAELEKPRAMPGTVSIVHSSSPSKPTVRRRSLPLNDSSQGPEGEDVKRGQSPAQEPAIKKAVKKLTLVRRKSICGSSDLHALKVDSERADSPDKAWETRVCALLWESMPPQCLAYAIGAGLHCVNSRKLRGRLVRSAWALLDQANAIDYSIGNIGVKRLRLEMDLLLDLFNRSIHFGEDPDPDELEQLLKTGRRNMAHLESIAQSSPVFAQVAVMYGVAFIAECMCGWAENVIGSATFVLSCRDLLRVLNPYLVQFFQRRAPEVDAAAVIGG